MSHGRVAKVQSSAPVGMKGLAIEIECDLNNGLPGITIVGLGTKAIDEAKERVKSALLNSGLALPRKRITINLSPADIPKDGSSYDLPIAVAILQASNQVEATPSSAFVGELALDGRVKPVPGIVVHALHAKDQGVNVLYVPYQNIEQATLINGVEIIGLRNLKELYAHLTKVSILSTTRSRIKNSFATTKPIIDFSDISGQSSAKRALEIAAAGRHNVLMTGPPGTGKTMLAKALVGILPSPSIEEVIEITNIHSLAGSANNSVIMNRPFRSPHHTSSNIALIGGGQKALPGEISLAHHGVLFMDELPEYPRSVLEALRQPLEDRVIDIARADRKVRYPADFMLIATQNPCPCGYYGDLKRECVCSAYQIQQYQKRVSGPLLDRIDLVVQVDRIESKHLFKNTSNLETSNHIQQRVTVAGTIQSGRNPHSLFNSHLSPKQLKSLSTVSAESFELLEKAIDSLQLSPRAAVRSLRVARTIADLDQSTQVNPEHISEALSYRQRNLAPV